MITIESSWGTILTDDEGNIISKNILEYYGDEECYLLKAVKFDILEWDVWYERTKLEPSPKPSEFDVLELGYWDTSGGYHLADENWRNNIYNA